MGCIPVCVSHNPRYEGASRQEEREESYEYPRGRQGIKRSAIMGEQTSLTDDLYRKDIAIAKLYNDLRKVESEIHFFRTTVSIAKIQSRDKEEHRLLSDLFNTLTSSLDWLGDLLFYLDDASEDIKSRSLSSYKQLRDMNNPTESISRVNYGKMLTDIKGLERRLFRLFDNNYGYMEEVKPCGSIFEILDDVMREGAALMKKIKEL